MDLNSWQEALQGFTVGGMGAPERDYHATITTPRGSVVVMPFLTEQEADDVARQYGPTSEPPAVQEAAKGEKQSCSRCGGSGGWNEEVRTTTPSGSVVVTKKWVNCRQCGGTGQVPK
ncbi:hypothetical protein [Streptomyces albidoflavus]|uniref:hypothetical protein n=1 Tax=Streptomyces albidoflavus TaxID=1886 RepID=UPI003319753F